MTIIRIGIIISENYFNKYILQNAMKDVFDIFVFIYPEEGIGYPLRVTQCDLENLDKLGVKYKK